MQKSNVPLQVLLTLLQNPLFKVHEVKGMRVVYLLSLQPLHIKGEMVRNLLPVEDTIDHVTTKQPHLYLVTSVRVDLVVLMDRLENVRCCRSVRKLQVVESFFVHRQLVSPLEVFDRHILQDYGYLTVGILKHQVSFHIFFLHLTHKFLELCRLHALVPPLRVNIDFIQRVRHLPT